MLLNTDRKCRIPLGKETGNTPEHRCGVENTPDRKDREYKKHGKTDRGQRILLNTDKE
jgi:hypothetical protein